MSFHHSNPALSGKVFPAWRRFLAPSVLAAVALLPAAQRLSAQTAVAVSGGKGSYASSVPAVLAAGPNSDAFYALPSSQVTGNASNSLFPLLHLDPALANSGNPIPSTHWWTDLMVGGRQFTRTDAVYTLTQSAYGGVQWVTPYRLDPHDYGFSVYYMNSWTPDDGSGAHAVFNSGQDGTQPLQIHGNRHIALPDSDILVADFETGYPQSWDLSQAGNAFGSIPTQATWSGHNESQFIDGGLVDTYLPNNNQGGNVYQGTISGNITVQKHYLHFKVGGGNDPVRTVVRLRDASNNVIYATTGVDPSDNNPDGTSKNNPTAYLHWVRWDVSAYQGQTLKFEIVDASSDSWGFIMCDEIVQSDAASPVGRYGLDMFVDDSLVTNWGDWNVDVQLQNTPANKALNVTMARGIPFTWTDWVNGLTPKIMVPGGTQVTDLNGTVFNTTPGSSFTSSAFAFTYQGHPYGIFLPNNTPVAVNADGSLEPQLAGTSNYMVIGYLPDIAHLGEFNTYAFARPTNTQLSWQPYNAATGSVATNWNITTTALKGSNLSTIQGWIPHHYRTTTGLPAFASYSYPTARGLMKCATGTSFTINYPFNGIVPILPAPKVTGDANPYQPSLMRSYLQNFNPGTMIGDTYWSGKALALCAQYMAWAAQTGDTADYNRLKTALEAAFDDWFTYTPGEETTAKTVPGYNPGVSPAFFTYYPDWHAFIGFGASYGSQAFNDLHFHYGYFTTAASTLAMYDPAFVAQYKTILTMIAKSYANYDRTDLSEPFLRMFDAWEGHSNAAGTSNSNDGENQESSSEAMQGWAGLFLLGGMTSDSQMLSAGAACYAMEGAATQEYWEDAYKTNFPSVYNRGYAGQVYGGSYAYATFFSGDPAWVYAIQWGPSNHWLNYLTRDLPNGPVLANIKAKFNGMWNERLNYAQAQPHWSSTYVSPPDKDGTYNYIKKGQWVYYNSVIYHATNNIPTGNPPPPQDMGNWAVEADCSRGEPEVLGDSPGHVVHAFQALLDPDTAAAEFDTYNANGDNFIAPYAPNGNPNNSQAGSTYYLIHSIRQAGQQDYTYTTSAPISSVYKNPKTGQYSYLIFNPTNAQQNVTVYQNNQPVGTIAVPKQTLIDSHLDAVLTSIAITAPNPAAVIQPGQQVQFSATGYDQYGATIAAPGLTWSVTGGGGTINASTGVFTATSDAYPVTVTAASGGVSQPYQFRVGPAPVLSSIALSPGFTRVAPGGTLQYSAAGSDQYGNTFTLDSSATWSVNSGGAGTIGAASGVFTAGSAPGTAYVTLTSGSVSSTTLVAVHAAPVNVALGKTAYSSSDLGANTAAKLTDGDTTTRWESTHGLDNQYVYVDLGAVYDLTGVTINWENAYAATYDVEVATDLTQSNPWTVAIPTTTKPNGLPNNPVDNLTLNTAGRYLKIGLFTRATAYGFSIWELQVSGYLNAASVTPTQLLLAPTNVNTLVNAQPTVFQAAAFDANYEGGLAAAAWTVSGGGTINGSTGAFTPTTAGGPFTVTAAYKGVSNTTNVTVANPPSSASAATNVALYQATTASSSENSDTTPNYAVDGNTNSRWSSAATDNEWMTVDLGSSIALSQVVLLWENAYGKQYSIRGSNDNATWTTLATQSNGQGGTETINVSGSYRYVKMQGIQRATAYGYSLYEFRVMSNYPPARTNKALGKAVTASSVENANTPAANAVDGDTTTRWSSGATDNECITVNFGSAQAVSQVVLTWENAYGKQYSIQGSNDGTTWATLAAQSNGMGGTETCNVTGTYQYIRMQGVQRATTYGYSLWELAVY